MLKMDLEYKSGILFVRLEGNLIRRTNYKINNYISPVLIKHKIKFVIYNLDKLKSIDESGIDSILNTKCIVKRNKGKIYLCNVRKELSSKIKRLRIKETSSEMVALKLIGVNMWILNR